MKAMSLLWVVAAAGGCASIATIRQEVPRAAYASTRSIGALEQCLAGSLSWIGAPSIIHGDGSTELSFGRGYGDSFLIVALQTTGAGTSVEVREQDGFNGKVRRSVERCISPLR